MQGCCVQGHRSYKLKQVRDLLLITDAYMFLLGSCGFLFYVTATHVKALANFQQTCLQSCCFHPFFFVMFSFFMS